MFPINKMYNVNLTYTTESYGTLTVLNRTAKITHHQIIDGVVSAYYVSHHPVRHL